MVISIATMMMFKRVVMTNIVIKHNHNNDDNKESNINKQPLKWKAITSYFNQHRKEEFFAIISYLSLSHSLQQQDTNADNNQ